jgi:hypothetical protein
MKIIRALAVSAGLTLPLMTFHAQAAQLKVFESNALKIVMDELGSRCRRPSASSAIPMNSAMRGTRSGCARAEIGHVVAPPSSVMNSRRFTR